MRHVYLVTFFLCVLGVSILGFRGQVFTLPPLDQWPDWAFPGMEVQPKHRPQSASAFFADGSSDRTPPPRTVARGMMRDDLHLHHGKVAGGGFAAGLPASLTVDGAFLERGRTQYQIYCAPCHGALGDGNGITKKYGMGATPSYHDPRLRAQPDGELYQTITLGKNTMMSYADKLTPEDRWAVVAYVRALQRAQQGTVADVTDAAGKKALGLQ
jgi:mono/diheme cytochrome c family protein